MIWLDIWLSISSLWSIWFLTTTECPPTYSHQSKKVQYSYKIILLISFFLSSLSFHSLVLFSLSLSIYLSFSHCPVLKPSNSLWPSSLRQQIWAHVQVSHSIWIESILPSALFLLLLLLLTNFIKCSSSSITFYSYSPTFLFLC